MAVAIAADRPACTRNEADCARCNRCRSVLILDERIGDSRAPFSIDQVMARCSKNIFRS
jgi:hypothetical protein